MWTKDECARFFKKVFGLEFTNTELEQVWQHLSKNKFTPVSRHGGNNVGFTPAMLQNLINLARARTGADLADPRFKKVTEEIIPAYTFALLLKRLNDTEYLIVSSDTPDIVLVDYDGTSPTSERRHADAVPIEALFITQRDFDQAGGLTAADKLAGVISEKKFSKRYVPQTALLITLNAEVEELDLAKLAELLERNSNNKFHQIWIFIGMGSENCVIASLTPLYVSHHIDVTTDLLPLLY